MVLATAPFGSYGHSSSIPHIFDAFGTGDTFRNVTAGFASILTALALLVGAWWALYKFQKTRKEGRTDKPQFSVDIAGQWQKVDGIRDALHLRIRVTNSGLSITPLNQFGTGLRVSFPAQKQPEPPDDVVWEAVPWRKQDGTEVPRTFEFLLEHAWVEPGETVSDDLLLNLGRSPTIAMVEVTIIRATSEGRVGAAGFSEKDIAQFAREIISPDATITDEH